MKILALTPYAPWPPYGGGTMRMYQLIRGLSAVHQVTCLTFVEAQVNQTAMNDAMQPTRMLQVISKPTRSLWRRAWQTLTHPWPDMALRNWDDDYVRVLDGLLQRETFDVVIAFSIEMAPYMAIVRRHGIPTCFDQFNAEYLIQKRAFLTDIAHVTRWHGAFYSLLQWRKLQRFERQVIQQCDVLTVVSPGDAQSLQALAPQVRPVVVPNGVDTRYFDRRGIEAHPFQRPTLVFSGTLDYRANVDALRWFVDEVLPLVRKDIPDVVLIAVGRRPHAALIQMQARGELSLTGEVDDTRPYMAGAHAYVVPMRIGGGVRLKVLEALALGVPMVSTSLGVDGIEGFDPQYCRIADDAQSMATAIVEVLDEPPDTRQARDFVRQTYDWQVIVPMIMKELQRFANATR